MEEGLELLQTLRVIGLTVLGLPPSVRFSDRQMAARTPALLYASHTRRKH